MSISEVVPRLRRPASPGGPLPLESCTGPTSIGGLAHAVLCGTLLLIGACASGNRPLQLVSGTGAIYPPAAREQGIEGHVVVRYDVDVEGRVMNARVVSATPPDVFDEAAVQAVSRWRFNAPLRGGEPQPVNGLESRLEFTLDGSEAYADY